MGRGLVGHDVDGGAHREQGRNHLGGVAEHPDRQRAAGVARRDRAADRVVDAVGGLVEVAVLDPAVDPGRIAVHAERHAAVHRHRERLRAAHAAQSRGQRDRPGQRAAEPLGRDGRERLVGALQDALGADVDPRAGRHLAEHGQPQALQPPELLPGGPLRHEQRVGDQHPGRPLVRPRHADRLARLDQQRLVVAELGQRRDDGVVGVPAARRAAGPAVHDELVRMLGHLRDRGCSSASAWPLPAATPCRSGRSRGERAPAAVPSGRPRSLSRFRCPSPSPLPDVTGQPLRLQIAATQAASAPGHGDRFEPYPRVTRLP